VARSVNAIMTATYWEIGRRIVEYELHGVDRAEYGAHVIDRLAEALTTRFGRGFGRRNLFQMRTFYLAYPPEKVAAALAQKPGESIVQTVSAQFDLDLLAAAFPLSWSHYVRLLAVPDEYARRWTCCSTTGGCAVWSSST
jgi:hypothetical protein